MNYHIIVGGNAIRVLKEAAQSDFDYAMTNNLTTCYLVTTAQLRIYVFAPKHKWTKSANGKWRYRL